VTVDWSLLLMLAFPIVYTVVIYRYVTNKYGVVPEEE
jgi:hypothetical protein